jgi:alkyl hydroperoxide reductase subunit D
MNVIGNPGVPKADFELYSLAVSAINGCGACVTAHERAVRADGVTAEGVQSAVRIAAVIHGVAVALESLGSRTPVQAAA